MGHYIFIGIIVAVLLGLQLYIFIKNLKQMREFRRTFGEPGKSVSYSAVKNTNGQVIGVDSDFSNPYFNRIRESIGEYMEANAGGTIDFQLIKDAVDRNCDSIEEDANAQIPLPLYIGLAGTMFGIIFGIGYLWITGQLDALLDLTQTTTNAAGATVPTGSDGVKTLLSGVAVAMIASIFGLGFTTWATWIFKGIKLEVEIGKNSFFTWMQSNLLPEVANDTVDAFRKLGRTLGRFNADFSRNADAFGRTMDRILGVNSTQNELLTNVERMNSQIEQMSQRNLDVASRLTNVMNVLNDFANYVQSINGYTTALQHFTEQFNGEADRIHVLEEMKEFFTLQGDRLKREEDQLKKGIGKLDNALVEGTNQLKNRFTSSNDDLKRLMTTQKEQFQALLDSQTKMFKDAHQELINSIRKELSALPQTASALNAVPEKIKTLLDGYKRENDRLVSQLSTSLTTVNRTLKEIGAAGAVVSSDGETVVRAGSMFPKWMNWTIIALVAIMALACVTNTFFGYKSYKQQNEAIEEAVTEDADSTIVEEAPAQPVTKQDTTAKSPIQGNVAPAQPQINNNPASNQASSQTPASSKNPTPQQVNQMQQNTKH